MSTINWRRVAFILAGIVVFAFALWFAARIPKTITIFVIAAFVASAVHPIVAQLEGRKVSRPLAITLVFTLLIVLAVVCVIVVMPMIFAQSQALMANVPGYLHTVQAWMLSLQAAIQRRFPGAQLPPQFFNLQQLSVEHVTAILTAGLASLGAFALNVATALFIALSALILSVFMLLNQQQLAEGFAAIFPTRRRQTALALASQATHVFGTYIAGQVIVSAITGILIALITWPLGFRFALLLGLISAVAYAVPVVGMLVAHVAGAILAAPQGLWMILWVEVIMFGIARLSDNLLVPKIMGSSVGLSPVGVLFAVFAGGELFGVPGLILGIPAAALIKLIWGYFIGPWVHAQIEFADLAPPPVLPSDLPDVSVVVTET
ncbi:MAG TPA: AI-2E family transporter [Candidatus Rubrimentiphilum sp.]|nr:AI-2E family transporter [Candidatus Rubrimentiphilum sp.]